MIVRCYLLPVKLNFMKNSVYTVIFLAGLSVGCNSKKEIIKPIPPAPPIVETQDPPGAPPKTWKEHWFDHVQVVNRVYYDSNVAVYYDGDVKGTITWPFQYMAEAWDYTKKTYGNFGDDGRLFVIYHAGKYGGGHPSTYMDASHDYRNVTDCGSGDFNAWMSGKENDIDISTHEIGHIVEGAVKGVKGSPAWDIWHDSKWMEIYQYDVYLGLNRPDDAKRWYNLMINTTDTYPRAGTKWFKDWFFPIYDQFGKTRVLNAFFTKLAEHFPKHQIVVNGKQYMEYDRRMNFGEFVHFWSGAAGANLENQAMIAFGDKDEKGNDWKAQLVKAKIDFPGITY